MTWNVATWLNKDEITFSMFTLQLDELANQQYCQQSQKITCTVQRATGTSSLKGVLSMTMNNPINFMYFKEYKTCNPKHCFCHV